MKRKIYADLLTWKSKPNRMPLILNGARQVGKTFILQEFGKKEFDNTVYINLEINKTVSDFIQATINPIAIIQYIEAFTQQRIEPQRTLLFFDEIQSNEQALTALKYFCEIAPEYYVVAAGSLLGVAVNREKFSFPVGKVDELHLYPMNFEEFLWAMNNKQLANIISEHYETNTALPEALHNQALELFNYYLLVGGMPNVVCEYIESKSLIETAQKQRLIINEYIADMAKYASPSKSVKIRECYNSIPVQLAKENKKFQYKIVQKGGTATIFGETIEWLQFAGIVLLCRKISSAYIPLKAYVDMSDFKLYASDVGILVTLSGFPQQMILTDFLGNNSFIGAIIENYVAQEFKAKQQSFFYWKNDNTAELDFVIQHNSEVIPIEVKSGVNVRSKSLSMFMKTYASPYGIRISKKNFGFENAIKSVPLYAVFCL